MRLYLEPHKIGDDRVWGCLGVTAGFDVRVAILMTFIF